MLTIITGVNLNITEGISMSIIQIVFSPTGGTQKVADIITSEWNEPVRKIDLSDPDTDFSSICLDKYEDTLIELSDAARKSGFRVIAGIAAVAEHSIMHQYASGRPDQKDESELRNFAKKIHEKISGDPSGLTSPEIPGNRPYKKAGGAALIPKANNKCTGCGICAENCPTRAISKDHLKTADSTKCISCMRCVARCPHKARKINAAVAAVAAQAIKKACSQRKEDELFC